MATKLLSLLGDFSNAEVALVAERKALQEFIETVARAWQDLRNDFQKTEFPKLRWLHDSLAEKIEDLSLAHQKMFFGAKKEIPPEGRLALLVRSAMVEQSMHRHLKPEPDSLVKPWKLSESKDGITLAAGNGQTLSFSNETTLQASGRLAVIIIKSQLGTKPCAIFHQGQNHRSALTLRSKNVSDDYLRNSLGKALETFFCSAEAENV